MNKDLVIKEINKNFVFLKEKFHVEKMGIFGSFARGEQGDNSDIDILVEFNMPIGFFDFIRLEKYLSEILGRKVDLVTKKALKSAIKEEILKETIYA